MFVTDPFRFQKTLRLATSTAALSAAAVSVGLNRTLRVSINTRSYAVAPVATGLRKASRVYAGVRSTAVAGVSTRVLMGRKLGATLRTYAVAPQASFLQRSRINGMTKADYAITPQAAGLLFKHKLSANAQALALQGFSANFLKVAGQLTANLQTMAVGPTSTILRKASRLSATLQGASITPVAAALKRGYPVGAQVRSVDLAAVAASLKKGSRAAAVKADYNIAAVSTTLTYTPIKKTYVGFYAGPTGSQFTTYTYSSVAYGSHQLIVVAIAAHAGATANVSSVTIGGTAATRAIRPTTNQLTQAEIWYAAPGNSSGSIVVNYTVQRSGSDITVYGLDSLGSTTPVYTDQYSGTGTTATVGTAFSGATTGDVGIAVASQRSGTARTFAWSGLTEDNDQAWASTGNTNSAASKILASTGSLSVSETLSGTTNIHTMVTAFWR